LINKLILSEKYFRDLSDIHEQKIRLLEKDIQLYAKSIDKYNVNEKEFRNKIELLEKDKQDLQKKNDKLTEQKKNRTNAFLFATGIAIIEGLLIVLISK
jgi:phage host-nuclease inhibitor protein Gam